MSARVGGVYSGWLLNHEPVVGFVFRVSYQSESRRRGDDAGSAGFIGPPRHCGSAVRTVGGREITPSSVDRTPYGLDEIAPRAVGESDSLDLDGSRQLPSGWAH